MHRLGRSAIAALALVCVASVPGSAFVGKGPSPDLRAWTAGQSAIERIQFFCVFDKQMRCGFAPAQGTAGQGGTGQGNPGSTQQGGAGTAAPGGAGTATLPLADIVRLFREARDKRRNSDNKPQPATNVAVELACCTAFKDGKSAGKACGGASDARKSALSFRYSDGKGPDSISCGPYER